MKRARPYYNDAPPSRPQDRLEWILQNTNADADEVCSLVLGSQGCGVFRRTAWSITLPPPEYPMQHQQQQHQQGREDHSRSLDSAPPQVLDCGRKRVILCVWCKGTCECSAVFVGCCNCGRISLNVRKGNNLVGDLKKYRNCVKEDNDFVDVTEDC